MHMSIHCTENSTVFTTDRHINTDIQSNPVFLNEHSYCINGAVLIRSTASIHNECVGGVGWLAESLQITYV